MTTKKEFVEEMASRLGTTKTYANKVIDIYQEIVFDALSRGDEEVRVMDGIKLIPTDKAEREGVNPSTGDRIIIPAHKSVKARIGSQIKKLVNA